MDERHSNILNREDLNTDSKHGKLELGTYVQYSNECSNGTSDGKNPFAQQKGKSSVSFNEGNDENLRINDNAKNMIMKTDYNKSDDITDS